MLRMGSAGPIRNNLFPELTLSNDEQIQAVSSVVYRAANTLDTSLVAEADSVVGFGPLHSLST
jgi:hypothetical protein